MPPRPASPYYYVDRDRPYILAECLTCAGWDSGEQDWLPRELTEADISLHRAHELVWVGVERRKTDG